MLFPMYFRLMAAIFDLRQTQSLIVFPNNLSVLPDPENINSIIAVGMSLLSCLRAEIYVISYVLLVMAAIFDSRHTQTSDSIPINLSVLPNPENMGLAVGISLLSFIRTEVYVTSYVLPINGRHL